MNMTRDRLTTLMMLGQMVNDEEVKAGRRAPDEPQIQLTGNGWRIWGGEQKEPKEFTVAELYEAILKDPEGTDELRIKQAQGILDMTRERCGELRLAVKRSRNPKEQKEGQEIYDKLRKELDEAIEIKKSKGITTIS